MVAFVGHLPEFSLKSSNWGIYKAKLENYFVANPVKADTETSPKRAILLNMMDKNAYKLMYDIVSPAKLENKYLHRVAGNIGSTF